MDKKFDALTKIYETMDPDAKGAVDLLAKGCELGLLAYGILFGVTLVKIEHVAWNYRQRRKQKKAEQK